MNSAVVFFVGMTYLRSTVLTEMTWSITCLLDPEETTCNHDSASPADCRQPLVAAEALALI
jgi:hypothetical protein